MTEQGNLSIAGLMAALAFSLWRCEPGAASHIALDPDAADSDGDSDSGISSDADSDSDIDEVIASLPWTCAPRNPDKPVCDQGTYDAGTGHCVLGADALGPFSGELIAACAAAGGGDSCQTNSWNRDFLLRLQETTGFESMGLLDVLDEIRSRPWIYCQPTAQDKTGNGIAQEPGGAAVTSSQRSEEIFLPFVLGPRRQVDSLVRQLYLILPEEVRRTTAFVVADRLVQNPEAYARYLRSRERAVIVGSFMGIGAATSYPESAAERHNNEMWQLRVSIALVHAVGREVSDVVYAMGDSSSSFALTVRADLQARLDRMLEAAGYAGLGNPISWGADETLTVALSRHLGPMKIRLHVSNENARHHYDSMRTTAELLAEKLPLLLLEDVTKTAPDTADFELAILTRRPNGGSNDFQSNDALQEQFDAAFLAPFEAYSAAEREKLAIVDGRIFNGAWNSHSVLRQCDLLAFGSWGTFGNVVGSTLSIARLLHAYGTKALRRQLYLEAVAHDVFSNGYEEAQRGALRNAINAQLGAGTWDHYNGYDTADLTADVFGIVNTHVNIRMQAHFKGTGCVDGRTFRHTPQLWRTFESEVHAWPQSAEEQFAAGLYRTDLDAAAFDPTMGSAPRFTFNDLLAEAQL